MLVLHPRWSGCGAKSVNSRPASPSIFSHFSMCTNRDSWRNLGTHVHITNPMYPWPTFEILKCKARVHRIVGFGSYGLWDKKRQSIGCDEEATVGPGTSAEKQELNASSSSLSSSPLPPAPPLAPSASAWHVGAHVYNVFNNSFKAPMCIGRRSWFS
jgi:hypothetical protein